MLVVGTYTQGGADLVFDSFETSLGVGTDDRSYVEKVYSYQLPVLAETVHHA